MTKFNISVERIGFATIEAETKEDALSIVENMGTHEFDWEMGFGVISCEEED